MYCSRALNQGLHGKTVIYRPTSAAAMGMENLDMARRSRSVVGECACHSQSSRQLIPHLKRSYAPLHGIAHNTPELEFVDACEAACEADDAERYYEENRHFHQVICTQSGNRFLVAVAEQMRQRLPLYRRLQLRLPRRMQESMQEPRQVGAFYRIRAPSQESRKCCRLRRSRYTSNPGPSCIGR